MNSRNNIVVGHYIYCEDAMWIVRDIVVEENERFHWYKVSVIWSGIGRRPYWANEPRTFLLNRVTK